MAVLEQWDVDRRKLSQTFREDGRFFNMEYSNSTLNNGRGIRDKETSSDYK